MNNAIINEIKRIGGGQMTRIVYGSDLPIKAEFKKLGYCIRKVVESTVRIGVNYNNIAEVVAKRENETPNETAHKKVSNYEWLVPNRICYNSNTEKTYVRVAPLNKGGANRKSEYIVTAPNGITKIVSSLDAEESNMVQNSYWTSNNRPVVQNISVENIIRVNKVSI